MLSASKTGEQRLSFSYEQANRYCLHLYAFANIVTDVEKLNGWYKY
ncbi:hypothetical protein D046_6589A, partial [Vibrio parahaemolyticus V-223/04]